MQKEEEKGMKEYQINAVNAICEFQKSSTKIAKMYLTAQAGKTSIIASAIEKMLHENLVQTVLLLSTIRVMCEQQKQRFIEMGIDVNIATNLREYSNHNIVITTYQDFMAHREKVDQELFDLIICDDAHFLQENSDFFSICIWDGKILGLFNTPEQENNVFYTAEKIFAYTINDAYDEGEFVGLKGHRAMELFAQNLLQFHGYSRNPSEPMIAFGKEKQIRPDIFMEKENRKYVFEVKYYLSPYVDNVVIEKAIIQIRKYKKILTEIEKNSLFVLILPCRVNKVLIQTLYKKENIVIWDISNLIYLCDGNQELLNLLKSATPYSLDGIETEKPIEEVLFVNHHMQYESSKDISKLEYYQKRLAVCNTGKENGADKEFETICTEIVKYLFETDFFRMSEQHKTEDEMFRMDLLCSLKGTKEFWRFLMNFYKTKFVVFEYKNYSDLISQNLIYITEKYLFSAALRNVAIIISRHGFDLNAQFAAAGCLKEHGKLIISLTDDDLIYMVAMKENGEEPSDYLLQQVEELLMAISK